MRAERRDPRGPRGFTLIEVIVALAILSVAVVAAIQGFAQGLRLLKLAGDHQYATLLADQKAREIVTPTAGHADGQDEHSGRVFAWETTTTEIAAPDLAGDGTRAPAWRVFQIDVKVRWDERREVELSTLRTAAATSETLGSTGAPSAGAPRSGTGPRGAGIMTPPVGGTIPRQR
jgi:type II secretion system protein I